MVWSLVISAIIVILGLAMKVYKMGPWLEQAPKPQILPSEPPSPQIQPEPQLRWDTQRGAYHAVRVTCDNANLSLDEKNLICACIYQESNFINTAVNRNKDKTGKVTSTDWGICQVNDYFHIGKGKDFPSLAYVLDNPEAVVKWMISKYKAGRLDMWVSFSSGAYKHWLLPNSPMWKLGITTS